MRIVFGLSSGIGNAAFCLPAIKAIRDHLAFGQELVLYVDGDYAMAELFERCAYATGVVDGSQNPPPPADLYVSGHWCPPNMRHLPGLRHYRWTDEPNYPEPEWSLAMQAARDLGWVGAAPDVSDWCVDLNRTSAYDVGIVPGCKPGPVWERKRWPGLADVSRRLTAQGLRCAVIGQPEDDDPAIVGTRLTAARLADLPEALASCRVIIGTDSGPLHLASSLGIPVVAVFTATNATKGQPIGPHAIVRRPLACSPCQSTPVWQACRDWQCREIAPALVDHHALEFLRAKV